MHAIYPLGILLLSLFNLFSVFFPVVQLHLSLHSSAHAGFAGLFTVVNQLNGNMVVISSLYDYVLKNIFGMIENSKGAL